MRHRHVAIASGLLLGLALSACNGTHESTLTVEGSFSGTTEKSCQVAVRDEATRKLVDSHQLEPDFRQDYSVEEKGRYYVEIHCADGKQGMSESFDYSPPHGGISLGTIELI